jgi:hypothetical protein
VIVITVSLILACIFVGYLGRHLARKYYPEWFRKGKTKKKKKKKKKKKNDNNNSKEGEADSKKNSTKVAVKPLDGTEEVSPMAGKPKSLGSIVPMQDTAVALDGELAKVMEPGDLSDSEQKLEQLIESSSINRSADTIDLAADPESGSGTADDLGGVDTTAPAPAAVATAEEEVVPEAVPPAHEPRSKTPPGKRRKKKPKPPVEEKSVENGGGGGGDIPSRGKESTRLPEFPEQPGGADVAMFLEDIAEEPEPEPEPEDGVGDIETGNAGYTGVPE